MVINLFYTRYLYAAHNLIIKNIMSDLPELRPNQIGVSCKTINEGALKTVDETLYFTINRSTVSMELYPNKPVIIIDKDAIKMILNKIAEVEQSDKEKTLNDSRSPLVNSHEDEITIAAADGDINELSDIDNNSETEAGKAATI